LNHGSVAVAARARLREREEALALGDHAAAVALGADLRRGARPRARTVTLRARGLEGDRDLRLDPLERVFEREVDLDLDVVAALRARLGAPRATAPAEEVAEEVAEITEVLDVEVVVVAAREATCAAGAPVGRAEGVVLLPLLGIGEKVIGSLHLFEA